MKSSLLENHYLGSKELQKNLQYSEGKEQLEPSRAIWTKTLEQSASLFKINVQNNAYSGFKCG